MLSRNLTSKSFVEQRLARLDRQCTSRCDFSLTRYTRLIWRLTSVLLVTSALCLSAQTPTFAAKAAENSVEVKVENESGKTTVETKP